MSCTITEKYIIVVEESPRPAVAFAGNELRKFLLQGIGFDLPIINMANQTPCIFVGKTEDMALLPSNCTADSFGIFVIGENVHIIGASERGTLYGVYEFLERYVGVKFLTSTYTIVPKIHSIVVTDEEFVSVPSFPIRMYLTASMKDDLFSARMRFHSEVFPVREEYGGRMKWSKAIWNMHNTLKFVPPSIYFTEENKEQNAHMYCINAKGKPVDLCMTDGITDEGEVDETEEISAFNIALNSLKRIVLEDPDAEYIGFSQEDSLVCCQCPRCKKAEQKYKRSGMNIIFVNLLLKKLREWTKEEGINRDYKIVIFAYNYSEVPPVKYLDGKPSAIVKADKDICVRIAPISTNCYYPLSSDMHFKPYKRIFDEWSLVCDKVMFWTYHTNYKCFWWFFPTMQHWKEDLLYLQSIGSEYAFMQSNFVENVDWKDEIETYVASKMLWDNSNDPYVLREEYIKLLYGIVAEEVFEIINIFERNYAEIAKRAERKRRAFNKQLFGTECLDLYDGDTESVLQKLYNESQVEWAKNVYFSIYHLEIMWRDEQPKELLEKQMALIFKAKEKINVSDKSENEKNRLICAVEKIEITLRFMISANFSFYYPNEKDREKNYKKELFELAKKFDAKYIGERREIDYVNYDNNFKFLEGQILYADD